MKLKSIKFVLALLLMINMGCDDFLDTPPLNELSYEIWFNNEEQIQMSVAACYRFLPDANFIMSNDCWSDNMTHRYGSISDITAGAHNAYTGQVNSSWRYDAIAKLNKVLEQLEASTGIEPEVITYAQCQVRFIRAFIYYDMQFLFGDVPLITKTLSIEESRQTKRDPKATVLQFIVSELEDILSKIGDNGIEDPGHVNKDVVLAYLTRINLYEKEYDKVLLYANQIINDSPNEYELFGDYDGLFRTWNDGNTKEVIFERQYSSPLYTHANNKYHSYPSSPMHGWLHNMPLHGLVEEYECQCGHPIGECDADCPYEALRKEAIANGELGEYLGRDPRLNATVVYPGHKWEIDGEVRSVYGYNDSSSKDFWKNEPTSNGYMMYKWLNLRGGEVERGKAAKNATIIRYADVLLMKAEALVEKNEDLGEVAKILNQIRKRAGMPENIVKMDQDKMRKALRHERRIELALEGLRYKDIIRWKIAGDVKNGSLKGSYRIKEDGTFEEENVVTRTAVWQDHMYLFPVPQDALDKNENLKPQNAGW